MPNCKLCYDDGWFRDDDRQIVACPLCQSGEIKALTARLEAMTKSLDDFKLGAEVEAAEADALRGQLKESEKREQAERACRLLFEAQLEEARRERDAACQFDAWKAEADRLKKLCDAAQALNAESDDERIAERTRAEKAEAALAAVTKERDHSDAILEYQIRSEKNTPAWALMDKFKRERDEALAKLTEAENRGDAEHASKMRIAEARDKAMAERDAAVADAANWKAMHESSQRNFERAAKDKDAAVARAEDAAADMAGVDLSPATWAVMGKAMAEATGDKFAALTAERDRLAGELADALEGQYTPAAFKTVCDERDTTLSKLSKSEKSHQETALDYLAMKRERDEAVARIADLLDYARHTHEARYYKADDGKMRLTDSCNKCGLDLRHEIHLRSGDAVFKAAAKPPSAAPASKDDQ